MEPKKWYASKTVWVNAIALVGAVLVGAGVWDNPLSPDTEVIILSVINFVLRFVTKEEIVWS